MNITKEQAIELAKSYARVAAVRLAEELTWAEHGDLVFDCQRLERAQLESGITIVPLAKMDRLLAAMRPNLTS